MDKTCCPCQRAGLAKGKERARGERAREKSKRDKDNKINKDKDNKINK